MNVQDILDSALSNDDKHIVTDKYMTEKEIASVNDLGIAIAKYQTALEANFHIEKILSDGTHPETEGFKEALNWLSDLLSDIGEWFGKKFNEWFGFVEHLEKDVVKLKENYLDKDKLPVAKADEVLDPQTIWYTNYGDDLKGTIKQNKELISVTSKGMMSKSFGTMISSIVAAKDITKANEAYGKGIEAVAKEWKGKFKDSSFSLTVKSGELSRGIKDGFSDGFGANRNSVSLYGLEDGKTIVKFLLSGCSDLKDYYRKNKIGKGFEKILDGYTKGTKDDDTLKDKKLALLNKAIVGYGRVETLMYLTCINASSSMLAMIGKFSHSDEDK